MCLHRRLCMIAKLNVVVAALLLLGACGVVDIMEQTDLAGSAGLISRQIIVKSKQKGSVVVVRFKNNNGILVRLNQTVVTNNGNYRFNVLPGEYAIFAFIDVNNDGKFQRGKEHGNYFQNPLFYKVKENQTVTIKPLVIKSDPPLPPVGTEIAYQSVKISKNIGKVINLSGSEFIRENYSMGMWRPIDFLEKVGGGLMMLQDYDKVKTPVIFVHGINGGPTDLKVAINNLDKKYFQPWVLYYPSGFLLSAISDYFLQAVRQLQKRHGFRKFIVIAHSMGGLVTRSFVKKYTKRFPANAVDIQLVMTINSPLGGMASAKTGVTYSPIVVPSWRDISPESDFIEDLNNWNWPSNIPYHLVFSCFHVFMFSCFDGDDTDGVVPLDSQIPSKHQSEATRIYGFNNNHVGTLDDEGFIKLFNSVLAKQTN